MSGTDNVVYTLWVGATHNPGNQTSLVCWTRNSMKRAAVVCRGRRPLKWAHVRSSHQFQINVNDRKTELVVWFPRRLCSCCTKYINGGWLRKSSWVKYLAIFKTFCEGFVLICFLEWGLFLSVLIWVLISVCLYYFQLSNVFLEIANFHIVTSVFLHAKDLSI